MRFRARQTGAEGRDLTETSAIGRRLDADRAQAAEHTFSELSNRKHRRKEAQTLRVSTQRGELWRLERLDVKTGYALRSDVTSGHGGERDRGHQRRTNARARTPPNAAPKFRPAY